MPYSCCIPPLLLSREGSITDPNVVFLEVCSELIVFGMLVSLLMSLCEWYQSSGHSFIHSFMYIHSVSECECQMPQ